MSDNTALTLEKALSIVVSRAPSHDTPDGGKLVIIPEGYEAHAVAPAEKPLFRIVQNVTMHDRLSFVAYVNRYKDEHTRVFAEPGFLADGKAHLTAVFDYHAPSAADYGVHTAKFSPRYSEQWQRWHRACTQPMKQAEFAEFIEEVRGDITTPSAASLLDIVRAFKATKKVEFDSVVYQPNGDVRLVYDERTEQKGQSGSLPEVMGIGIPVYYRGTPYALSVLVRYKLVSGAVVFSLKIDRADIIEDAAFSELTEAVKLDTGIEAYLGRR